MSKKKNGKSVHSLSELARRLGVTVQCVWAGARRGRLGAGMVDGKIVSLALAEAEWERNRRRVKPLDGAALAARAEVQARHEAVRAEFAELKLEERRDSLVAAAEVEPAWRATVKHIRAVLLALPARWRAQCPSVSVEAEQLVAKLTLEALEDLDQPLFPERLTKKFSRDPRDGQ